MKIQRFENGMTVAELKAILAEWPDTRPDGTPCEVWLGDRRNLSNQVKELSPLNAQRDKGGTMTADLILSHD